MDSKNATTHLQQVEQRMHDLIQLNSGAIATACAAHLEAGGSRVRARLALQACTALRVSHDDAIAVASACELLHNASLVHDDLQDRDTERRGRPALWHSFGEAVAICAGDLFLSAAYAALTDTGARAAPLMACVHRRVAEVIRGQGEDLALRTAIPDSLETYERVARAKSGPLLILPLELSLTLAHREAFIPAATEACACFAVGYQAADDLVDEARDALHKELNLVAVFAARGVAEPIAATRALALERFTQARAAALRLPSGCGDLLAELAAQYANDLATSVRACA
ncbi:MAG: polyprenyl synthetase family protein [Acidithiobacillus sp.]|uniref:polyprenyl synthetase family protein n=1 Tax=Acidithiobacillus sp. TaxID=1872118 RepID=UPI003D077B99